MQIREKYKGDWNRINKNMLNNAVRNQDIVSRYYGIIYVL